MADQARDTEAPVVARQRHATCASPPRKARLVADQVRGMRVDEAPTLLQLLAPRRRRDDPAS